MIDLHTHLLPGVDDGARTFAASAAVLERFAATGVEMVVCTPHLRASEAHAAPAVRNTALLQELRARVPGAPELRLGWEIMLDRPGADLFAPELRLGDAPAILVEFPRTGVPPRAGAELYRLRQGGVVPVVAHPERYWGVSLTHVREWRAAGAVMQGDATILLGTGERSRLARTFLANGLLDVLASDNHGDVRSIAAARTWLTERGAAEQAALLLEHNPRRLLAGEPLEAVPPADVEPGVIERLRALLRVRG